MTSISIDTNIYNEAKLYAEEHNISVRHLFETYVLSLIKKRQVKDSDKQALSRFSPELRKYIGIAKDAGNSDVNEADARWEYLKEKHDL